jgi:ornithine cyclodeaminase/alanine dehydrogenase-like protein (mu-crystallin family)
MTNNKQQTAVEWLVEHWKKLQLKGEKMSWNQIIQITELVKEMEKEQIIIARSTGLPIEDGVFTAIDKAHKHYNETYGGGEQ